MEIKAAMLQVRVDAAREVLRRSRITFLTSVIISLSLFISSFNAHWSWYRRWPLQHDEWAKSDVVQKLQESVYEEWAKSRYITIAPLGIQVGSRDAVPLGAMTLLLVSAWSFGCVRRHTYVIRQLLLDTREETLDVRRGVYHGIAAQRLYSEVTGIDEPTTRMDGRTERAGYAHVVQSGIRWLPYLPTLMIGLLLIMDMGSIYWEPAPLRENHQTLMEEFCIDAGLACDSGKLALTWELLTTPKARGDDEAAKKIAQQRENLVWALGAWAIVLVIAGFTFHFAYRTVGLEADVDADR